MRKLNILIWQIHGSYLNTLVQAPHRFYLPTKPGKPEGYGGRGPTYSWSPHTVEVPAEEVRELDLDLVIYQTPVAMADRPLIELEKSSVLSAD